MKVRSVAAKAPSLKITNERIICDVGRLNSDVPSDVVSRYQRELSLLLKKTGAKDRYYRDRSKNETALAMVKQVIAAALREAEMEKGEIDLLVFCGVGRGFLEPANAYFCAKAMSMECNCFDVSDACMSWVRALEISYHLLKNGAYRNILIVNAEFTVYEYGYPDVFRIRSPEQLAYTFPAYTIGEAASATVVSRSDDEWRFCFEANPELVSLCTIPLKGYKDFCEDDGNLGLNGVNGFVSFGIELFDAAVERMVDLSRSEIVDLEGPDIWFPHAAAADPCRRAAALLGIDRAKFYQEVFPPYGNLVSASIPMGMRMALDEGRLRRGDRVVLCPASAGMVFSIVEFTF